MALIDTLLARRQKLLLMAAFGFTMWQGGQLLAKIFPTDDTTKSIAVVMTLVGAFQWAACSFGFIHYSKKAKPERDALNDELTCKNKTRAFTFGYTVLLSFIMFFFVLNVILEQTSFPVLNADIIIHGLFIIGVVAPTLRFVWLERDNA